MAQLVATHKQREILSEKLAGEHMTEKEKEFGRKANGESYTINPLISPLSVSPILLTSAIFPIPDRYVWIIISSMYIVWVCIINPVCRENWQPSDVAQGQRRSSLILYTVDQGCAFFTMVPDQGHEDAKNCINVIKVNNLFCRCLYFLYMNFYCLLTIE